MNSEQHMTMNEAHPHHASGVEQDGIRVNHNCPLCRRAVATQPDLLAACESVVMTAVPGAPGGYFLVPAVDVEACRAAAARARAGL